MKLHSVNNLIERVIQCVCKKVHYRVASSRDEWASASLHNANTRCNVMIPVWSDRVKDSDMELGIQRFSLPPIFIFTAGSKLGNELFFLAFIITLVC